MESSNTTEQIKDAMRLFHRGDRKEARELLAAMWEELSGSDDAFNQAVVAHYIADTRDDPEEELEWDLKALQAAESVKEDSPAAAAVASFMPSLYLNLADDYRRKGDFIRARHHADRGLDLAVVLKNDHYGHTVRSGLFRVDTQISESESGPGVIFDFD